MPTRAIAIFRRSKSATSSWCATSAPTAPSMGHTYLRRPLPPEVLIDGDEWRVIRRRQTLDELLALETE